MAFISKKILYLLSNEDLSVDIGINSFIDHTPETPVTQIAQGIKETLEKNSETFDFQDITSLQNVDGIWFEFSQTTLDNTELFHIMAFMRISGQIVQLSFNCLRELDIETWKSIVSQMLESIKKYEKKGEHHEKTTNK